MSEHSWPPLRPVTTQEDSQKGQFLLNRSDDVVVDQDGSLGMKCGLIRPQLLCCIFLHVQNYWKEIVTIPAKRLCNEPCEALFKNGGIMLVIRNLAA